MALSYELTGAGHKPQELNVSATVGLDPQVGGGWEISRSHLVVRGKVEGIDQARFEELAELAKDACPVSKALIGNVEVTFEAKLDNA
jgi:osmotically inducible protein OsmC